MVGGGEGGITLMTLGKLGDDWFKGRLVGSLGGHPILATLLRCFSD